MVCGCIRVSFFNPCAGCCAPVHACLRRTCGEMSQCWYTVGKILQLLSTLAVWGMLGLSVANFFSCEVSAGIDGSDGPLDAAVINNEVDSLVVKIVPAVCLLGYIISESYIIGVSWDCFSFPLGAKTEEIEVTLWNTFKRFLKFFWVLPTVLASSGAMDECFVGDFIFLQASHARQLTYGWCGLLFLFFGCLFVFAGAKKYSILCCICECFAGGCYWYTCVFCIFIVCLTGGMGVTMQIIGAYESGLMSFTTLILAAMVLSVVGMVLQLMCDKVNRSVTGNAFRKGTHVKMEENARKAQGWDVDVEEPSVSHNSYYSTNSLYPTSVAGMVSTAPSVVGGHLAVRQHTGIAVAQPIVTQPTVLLTTPQPQQAVIVSGNMPAVVQTTPSVQAAPVFQF